MSAQIALPGILQIGENATDELANVLAGLGCKRPLIVTDKMMLELAYVGRIQSVMQAANIDSDVYHDTVPEPTVASIQAGVEKVRTGNYDCLIAIGGGSPIDSAKAIAILGRLAGNRNSNYRGYRFGSNMRHRYYQ